MEDIAPLLLEQIKELYKQGKEGNKKIIAILKNKKAGYIEAGEYADELGKILADSLGNTFAVGILPDGRLYYNIAKRTVEPTMQDLQSEIADFTEAVQERLNNQAGLGIKAIRPELKQDRIDGIIDRLSNAESFEDIKWIIDEPIKTFARSTVDDAIKANAEFQGKSGMSPKIIRRSSGNCCEWCTAIEGSYEYPDVPKDVYRRHNRCGCTVDYVVGKRKQNVWSKTWSDENTPEKIENRKSIPYKTDVAKKKQKTQSDQSSKKQYTKSDLDKMSLNELKETAGSIALEYYKSGKSGISFGGSTPEHAVQSLLVGKSKAELKKDILSIQKAMKK